MVGLFKNIVVNTIQVKQKEFGYFPEDMLAD
jgi:hypothetical protein